MLKYMPERLYIYGTVWNSRDYVIDSVRSLQQFTPFKIIIVDNFSGDGTYEELKKVENVILYQARCTRGTGRNIALQKTLKMCNSDDLVLYADFDTIFKPNYVDLIKEAKLVLKKGELYLRMMLSYAETNYQLDWKNLNTGEDWERLAHAKKLGIRVFLLKGEFGSNGSKMIGWENGYFSNRPNAETFFQREMYYQRSKIRTYFRVFREMIQIEIAISFKSMRSYLDRLGGYNHPFPFRIALSIPYLIGKILGTYSYDERLNNIEFVDFDNIERR